jgi:hypothetical protein
MPVLYQLFKLQGSQHTIAHQSTNLQTPQHFPRGLALWVAQGRFPAAQHIGRKNFWTRAAVERWKTLLFSAQENWTPGSATRREI